MSSIDPFDVFRIHRGEAHDPRYGIMGAFSALMGQQLADRGYIHDIRNGSDAYTDHDGFGLVLIFGGQVLIRLTGNCGIEALSNGVPGIEVLRGNAGNYFIGPGLEELLEQLAATDHRGGTPPAASSGSNPSPQINKSNSDRNSIIHENNHQSGYIGWPFN
ncbi:hypothetical protein MLD38_033223 [Melastoma candidum]|uniref:Uncharacterized protein n=1 Tax=Melastoma candidum TaxID=119954 RepID=A0ACB9M7V7_9MYRT|nr:hypothetical protein MLD38_033223 [Melastoma candidum]